MEGAVCAIWQNVKSTPENDTPQRAIQRAQGTFPLFVRHNAAQTSHGFRVPRDAAAHPWEVSEGSEPCFFVTYGGKRGLFALSPSEQAPFASHYQRLSFFSHLHPVIRSSENIARSVLKSARRTAFPHHELPCPQKGAFTFHHTSIHLQTDLCLTAETTEHEAQGPPQPASPVSVRTDGSGHL